MLSKIGNLSPGTAQEFNKKFNFREMLLTAEQIELIRKFVAEAKWIWAKTYAKTAPHWYVLNPAKNGEDDTAFKLLLFANQHCGYDRKFFRRTVPYFDLDGYTYWGGYPDNRYCDLINRVKSQLNTTPYPAIGQSGESGAPLAR